MNKESVEIIPHVSEGQSVLFTLGVGETVLTLKIDMI